jgi:RNA-binding protein
MQLTTSQLRHLRGLTHHISPVVMVAGKGLSDTVMAEIEQALDHHELIKVKLRGDRKTRAAWAEEIGRATGAATVHTIGQVACFYRPNPERRVVELPRS